MADFIHELRPEEAQYLSANFPQLARNLGTNFPVSALGFDPTTQQTAYWKFTGHRYASGNLNLRIFWYADTATANNVVWEAAIAAITGNVDTQDVETKAFATINFVQDTHLGTTGQRLHFCDIPISNLDSIADGDALWIKIARDADGTNATDDMTGIAWLERAVLTYLST